MIKNIVFDIGNVLLTWSPKYIVTNAFPNKKFDSTLAERIFDSYIWSDLDRGKISLTNAIEKFSNYLGFSLDEFSNFRNSVFESFIPIEGSLELLRELEACGIHLYSVTDCAKEVYDFLVIKYSFFKKFRDIVSSGYFGSTKPDLAIYHYLFERNNILPTETIFIDDKLKNIDAAKLCGMHGIHFYDAKSCKNKLNTLLGQFL